MHPLRAKYLAVETAISIGINAAISIGFAWLVFHGHEHVPVSGRGGLLRDAAPQTFMITLMSTLVPSLITRERMRSGHLNAWLYGQSGAAMRPTRNIVLRALILAIIGMGIGLAVSAAALPLAFPGGLPYDRVLVFKAAYGAIVALIVTPVAMTWALGDSPKLRECKESK